MHLLEVENVTRRFGGLTAVSQVSFQVDEGEILGLIGPNGAGKTTVFNLISASLKPDAGRIVFAGRDITGMAPYRICRLGLARTFQTVKVFANMPVFKNVMIGSLFGTGRRLSATEARRAAEKALSFMELLPFRNTLAGDLTLANQKRLEMARALATEPKLLLLDELMAGLTPTEVAQAMEQITRVRDEGITVIMIEHVMQAIMSISDRIVVLDHGQKIAEGSPQAVAKNQRVIEVYLGEEVNA